MNEAHEQRNIQEHHQKTGCRGDIKPYETADGGIHGFFCTCCKKEWLSELVHVNPPPSTVHTPVSHHIVPSFCCLQTSDTGNYVSWKNINESTGGLKPGDHVAWLRILSYWHHAIVEEVNDDSIRVIELSSGRCSTHIHQRTMEYDLLAKCGWSFMYKAYYPQHVLDLNPPELVLLRARARLNDTGYGPLKDNCEHFATFCKTGEHRCNQLHQLRVTMRAWLRKFVTSLLHIAIIVSFSEVIERYAMTGADWLGVLLLIISEMIYLAIFFYVVWRVDTRRQEFHKEDASCTRACRCASVKAVLQSITLVVFAAVFSVYLERWIREKRGPWTIVKETGVQIGLGILGGLVGNVVGFVFFSLFAYPCCRNEILPDVENVDGGGRGDIALGDDRNQLFR